MKKRILIITDALPPSFAPRMSYLMNELSAKGYDITAFAIEQPQSNCNLPTGNASIHNFVYASASTVIRLKNLVGEVLFDYKNKWFYRQIKPHLQGKTFDAILCSTYETFPLPAALTIAKELQLPLVADLRDITEQFGDSYFKNRHPKAPWLGKWFANCKMKQRNKVIKQANAVVSVSPWHRDYLKRWNGQVHLIYNGYDANKFAFQPISSEKFTITYTGRLVDENIQDPTLLLAALQALLNEQKIAASDIQLHWYTDHASQQRLMRMIDPYPAVSTLTTYHELVPAEEIPQLLLQSSVVLVLSNQTTKKGPKGIMTTKFFEALGVEKPVLCVRSDEACLAATIKQTNAGLAATNVGEVKAFLLEKYQQWKQQGYTQQAVIQAEKVLFSRQEQAIAFEKIIQSVL